MGANEHWPEHDGGEITQSPTRSCLFVIGGSAKTNATRLPEWQGFQTGLILGVRPADRTICLGTRYRSPPHLCPDSDPSFVFKAGTRVNDRLYVCTQTEVLIYSVPSLTILHHISHPWFNDLHHVLPLNDERLLVAATGLDMVLDVDLTGEIIRSWDVLGDPSFSRFPQTIDYRKVPTTKPHRSHPNHLFILRDEIWVTRFVQRDAICLTDPTKRIDLGIGGPHDGVVVDHRVYFTTVEGNIVIADPKNPVESKIVDLNEITPSDIPLGWCRGIKIIDENEVVVGFSRLRPTRWQIGISLLKSSIKPSMQSFAKPTRLACYDLKEGSLRWELGLEDNQMNAVFSIL